MPSARLRRGLARGSSARRCSRRCSSSGSASAASRGDHATTTTARGRRPRRGRCDWRTLRRGRVRDACRCRSTPRAPDGRADRARGGPGARGEARTSGSATLLVNPGGPGAPGRRLRRVRRRRSCPTAITDRFDIVGWDPRGPGESNPVDCGKNLDYLLRRRHRRPTTPPSWRRSSAASQRFARRVRAAQRRPAPAHLDRSTPCRTWTGSAAALGDEKLTYIGLLVRHATSARSTPSGIPDHVRALRARRRDRPRAAGRRRVDPAGARASTRRSTRSSSTGATRTRRCAFHGGGDVRGARYDALARRIDASPSGDAVGLLRPDAVRHRASPRCSTAARPGTGCSPTRCARPSTATRPRCSQLYDDYVGARPAAPTTPSGPRSSRSRCADGPNLVAGALPRRSQRAGRGRGARLRRVEHRARATRARTGRPAGRTTVADRGHARRPRRRSWWWGPPATRPRRSPGRESLTTELGTARLVAVDDTTHTASLNGNPCLDAILDARTSWTSRAAGLAGPSLSGHRMRARRRPPII